MYPRRTSIHPTFRTSVVVLAAEMLRNAGNAMDAMWVLRVLSRRYSKYGDSTHKNSGCLDFT